jgi:hypothetical protein
LATLPKKLPQLINIDRDPPRFVFAEQLGG